jgi:DNA polymerase-3 subunit beta
MRLRIERDKLADAVAWTARSLPSRPAVPVLGGLLIDVAGSMARLSTFDYEVCAQADLTLGEHAADDPADQPADQSVEPGTVLVPGRLFAEIIRGLPAEPVELRATGGRLSIECGGFQYTLMTMPVQDYPALPALPPRVATLGADAFAAAVGQVVVAAGRDQTLPLLTAIRLADGGELLSLGCTDRYRMAVRRVPWRRSATAAIPVMPVTLVPAKTLADAVRMLGTSRSSGAEVHLSRDAGTLGLECGDRRLVSRLVDTQSPDYDARVPFAGEWRAEVEAAPLVEAIKRVALAAAPLTPMRLSFTDGAVRLEAASGDEIRAAATLSATLHGEPIDVALKAQFLLDALLVLDSDLATLTFTAPGQPILVTGKEDGFRYLIAPQRV